MKDWTTRWIGLSGLPPDWPEWAQVSIFVVVLFSVVILPVCGIMLYVERKIGADLQARVGPNRAGPSGLAQPLADTLKLLQKDVLPGGFGQTVWLVIHAITVFATLVGLPVGSALLLLDTDISAFIPFTGTLALSFGVMLLGLNHGSPSGRFGALRTVAQALAGFFPALLCLLYVGMWAGGFSWSAILLAQGASPVAWMAFSSPFGFMAFVVFVISGLVMLGLPPLDGCGSMSDLRGGVSASIQGRRLVFYRVTRFYAFFMWTLVAVTMFLGGAALPDGGAEAIIRFASTRILAMIEMAVLVFKTAALMICIQIIARVTPRIRSDQVTDFSLKVLSPFALVALAGAALWIGRGWLS
ncbi:MAG: hypothetical protein A2583_06535 [Bdellovibrionales bacterium RIFOXYD1_FULL_53_11]|nr:MAG: hypothetical protein A2583_06535 [Bdellovibrionales bacterium RIFOXYD1_FULL_53_11]